MTYIELTKEINVLENQIYLIDDSWDYKSHSLFEYWDLINPIKVKLRKYKDMVKLVNNKS